MSKTIPMTVTNLGEHEYPVNLYHHQFHQKRIVKLQGIINGETAESIIAQLKYLDEQETADICLEINSPGVSVNDGMAVYDCIRYGLRSDVITVGMGIVASMGAFLLSAGAKGKRFLLPHTQVMIHQPLGGVTGQAADISIEAENILHIRKMLNEILAENTGQPLEKIQKDTDRNYYMTAKEALAYGIADEVGFPCLPTWGNQETRNNENGWSSSEEIREVLLDAEEVENVGGPVLFRENGKKFIYGGDGHSIILGTSGYGKTACMVKPLIRELGRAGESMIIADPGDLHHAHEAYLRKRGYQIIVFDFRHLYQSERWNPLKMITQYLKSGHPEKVELGDRMLRELAKALFVRGQEHDPFWINSSRNLFIGAVKLLIDHVGDSDMVTLESVFKLIISGEAAAGLRTYLQAYLEEVVKNESDAADLLHAYLDTAKETKGSIRSVFESNLAPFVFSKALKTTLSNDGALDISELKEDRPTAIFVIINNQSKAYDEISAVLLGQLIQHYIFLADESQGSILKNRMNVLLEELGNIGHCMGDLDRWMSGARSRNIRFHLVLQSYYSQLDDIYGRSAAETIRSNVKVLAAFCVNDLNTLRYLSELCGEKEEKKGSRFLMRPLLTPAELHMFGVGKALIFAEGRKFVQQLPFYEEDYDVSGWEPPLERAAKYEADIRTFDVKAHVDAILKQRLDKISQQMEELGMRVAEEDMEDEREADYKDTLFTRCIDNIHPDHRRMLIRKKECLMEIPFFVRLSGVNERIRPRVIDILERFGFETEKAASYADTEGAEIPVDELPRTLDLIEILKRAGAEALLVEDMEG